MTDSPAVAVIVVAAGSGTRLGRPEPKAFVTVAGRPMLDWALRGVYGMRTPAQVIVVVPEGEVTAATGISRAVAGPHLDAADVVTGGTTRQESVSRGLAVVRPGVDTVLVHDAARALTPPALFDAVVDAVRAGAAGAVPGLPVVDTIKRVAADGRILSTVDRSDLSAVQTPQGFPRRLLDVAASGALEQATDDASLVAAAGHPVVVIPGHPRAFKITTEWDLRRAELLLAGQPAPRVGTGVDVHAVGDDDAELWLAGLLWPGERGLSGHSDGDAGCHAICDALLAAAGLGDLGLVFGTADPSLAGAHGWVFLQETLRRVTDAGFRVGNVSLQLIGNRPRIAHRRVEAEQLLSSILRAPVTISATTTDGLGFTGRGEGVAAVATALLIPVPGAQPDLSWEA